MLLVSLLELVPESIGIMGAHATVTSFVLGAGLVWTAHLIGPHTHLVEEKGLAERTLIRSAYLVVFGLVLHDVPEGFAMANAYIAAPALGVLAALAEPLGAVIGRVATGIAPALNAHFMAFAAGAMTFVSLHEPVPMARRCRHMGLLVAGMLLSAVVYGLLSALTTAVF